MRILHAYRIVCLLRLITPRRDPKSFGIQLLPKIFPFTYKYFFCFKYFGLHTILNKHGLYQLGSTLVL